MLPSAPLVMTIVLGGAGFTKCSVIQKTIRTSSRNGPSVTARSRHEMREILKLGRIGLRTLVKRAVGCPARAQPWDVRISSPPLYRHVARPTQEWCATRATDAAAD